MAAVQKPTSVRVRVEWLAWSDHGGGVAKGGSEQPVELNPLLRVADVWRHLPAALRDAPDHYSRLWCCREGRFMHDQGRTLESYGLKDGDTLYALCRCAQPLTV